jgi:hypothetical protein
MKADHSKVNQKNSTGSVSRDFRLQFWTMAETGRARLQEESGETA